MSDQNEVSDKLYDKPSKTTLKRESVALQKMGAELAALSATQLQALDLPEILLRAVTEASQMPAKGARKRLLKYVGGLLRDMDVDSITEKLAKLNSQSVHSAREHHQVEDWRDRLINQDDKVLTDFLSEYPDVDRQQLRQLVRNAKKELQLQKPPRYARQLFRFLKELIQIKD